MICKYRWMQWWLVVEEYAVTFKEQATDHEMDRSLKTVVDIFDLLNWATENQGNVDHYLEGEFAEHFLCHLKRV